MTRLYIGNVSSKGDGDLKELLSECGKIKNFDVKDGSGYMEFETPEEAEDAIKKFHDFEFNGSRLIVEPARKTVPRGGRGGRIPQRRRRSYSRSSSRSRSRSRNKKSRRHRRDRSHSRSRSGGHSSRSRSRSRDRNHKRKYRRSSRSRSRS